MTEHVITLTPVVTMADRVVFTTVVLLIGGLIAAPLNLPWQLARLIGAAYNRAKERP